MARGSGGRCPGGWHSQSSPPHGFSCPKRPRALWMAVPCCCGRGGPRGHKQMLRQPTHCVGGANTCTLGKGLTGLTEPPSHLSCAHPRQRRRTCQVRVGDPLPARSCCVDERTGFSLRRFHSVFISLTRQLCVISLIICNCM